LLCPYRLGSTQIKMYTLLSLIVAVTFSWLIPLSSSYTQLPFVVTSNSQNRARTTTKKQFRFHPIRVDIGNNLEEANDDAEQQPVEEEKPVVEEEKPVVEEEPAKKAPAKKAPAKKAPAKKAPAKKAPAKKAAKKEEDNVFDLDNDDDDDIF